MASDICRLQHMEDIKRNQMIPTMVFILYTEHPVTTRSELKGNGTNAEYSHDNHKS
jgi:hypothetical protein